MDDGTWRWAEVLSESRDIRGNWRVKLLWYGTGDQEHDSQREDWFMYSAEKIRRLED